MNAGADASSAAARTINARLMPFTPRRGWKFVTGRLPPIIAARWLISSRNSIRVRELLRKAPSMALVTANDRCFSTPRIAMQRCVASMTTATPSGWIFSSIVCAIWFVSRSCTCRRRLNTSTSRGILLRPMTFVFGM